MSTKKRSLVIITCLKDKWKFEMLMRSMYAMLEPCDVIIVYNEGAKKYKEWLDWFLPLKETLLKNFSVRYFKAGDFIDKKDFDFIETSGWHSQQALKLLVYDQIFTDEYVILDSKNFFLKNCSLMDIVRSEPHGHWTLKGVTAYTEFMCNYLDMVYPGHHLKLRANVTPYIMQTKLVRRLVRRWKTHSKFYDWFIDTAKRPGHSAAEFILYELWELKMQQRIIDNRPTPTTYSNYATIWHHSLTGQPSANEIGKWIWDQRNKGILVGGFHSGIHKHINLADVKLILKMLKIEYILPQAADSPF